MENLGHVGDEGEFPALTSSLSITLHCSRICASPHRGSGVNNLDYRGGKGKHSKMLRSWENQGLRPTNDRSHG